MKKVLTFILKTLVFIFLTALTQVGGFIYLLSISLSRKLRITSTPFKITLFISLYAITTFAIVPAIAPQFGREKIRHTKFVKPTNYITVVLNRNYVRPDINLVLKSVENELIGTGIQLNYLDANFPFFNGFPLLPHLSHNDGRKLDLSLVYETPDDKISVKQKSRSGYGVFETPKSGEQNQAERCITSGYFQYSYPKYLTFGTLNDELHFSEKGTKRLAESILKQPQLEKLFIEPHLKSRLKLKNEKVRFHGCVAVRHDDHIHLQVK